MKKKIKRAFFPCSGNGFLPVILQPKNLFILTLILLILKILVFSWFFCYPKTDQFAIVASSRLVELANQERIAFGLEPLSIDSQLVQAAKNKAQDMINKGYFAHISPDGLSPWFWLDRVGYNYVAAGENLAKDFTDSEYLHNAWMNSSSHRANILKNDYKEIGVAVVEGVINGKKTTIAVQFFGKETSVYNVKLVEKDLEISKDNTEAEVINIPELENLEVKGEEISLKGPKVFEYNENLESLTKEPRALFVKVKEDSEIWVDKLYFIILGILGLVLLLTIFINIRVQYPKVIFTVLAIIILLATITLFNDQEFLNRGIDVI